MRVAILDLGTNLFSLLIADISRGRCHISKIIKEPSEIGRGGLKSGKMSEEALNLSIKRIESMLQKGASQGEYQLIKAYATSAVRESSNSEELVRRVREQMGVEIEIISGAREAELVYKGVRESMLLYNETILILDVGGGSNELILANREQILWKESFPIGVVRIREEIEPDEIITNRQIERYIEILEGRLAPFFKEFEKYNPSLLVGSSGSFDTLRELIFPEDDLSIPARELPLESFFKLHQRLLLSNRKERLKMAGMNPLRVDYMVLGTIFINYLIKKTKIEQLYQSSYSLKEGSMAEIAESLTE